MGTRRVWFIALQGPHMCGPRPSVGCPVWVTGGPGMPGPYGAAKLSVPRIQEAAAAEETAHEQKNKNADLIDGPAGGRGQGGDFGAQ